MRSASFAPLSAGGWSRRWRGGLDSALLLYRWQGEARNFGDELNALLWPRLLPDFFDDDPAEVFLGIGSVLDARHVRAAVKLVAGAGYGGYEPLTGAGCQLGHPLGPRPAAPPACSGFHRLPASAIRRCWLAGPASQPSATPACGRRGRGGGRSASCRISRALERGAWAEAAAAAGVELIDPRGDPQAMIAAIGRCRLLLSEALAWRHRRRRPARALDRAASRWCRVHRPKWQDWAESLELRIEFRRLAASSLPEWLHASRLAAMHTGRRLLDTGAPMLRRLARRRFVEQAAQALGRAVAASPQTVGCGRPWIAARRACWIGWRRCAAIHAGRRDAASPDRCRSATASALHPRRKSAYHPARPAARRYRRPHPSPPP